MIFISPLIAESLKLIDRFSRELSDGGGAGIHSFPVHINLPSELKIGLSMDSEERRNLLRYGFQIVFGWEYHIHPNVYQRVHRYRRSRPRTQGGPLGIENVE